MAHSKLGPSASARWMGCPASVQLTADMPNPSSSFAIEGTTAHWVGEQCLVSGEDAISLLGVTCDETGQVIPKDMPEYVQEYLDYVRQYAEGGTLYVEEQFSYDLWVPGGFGTSDATIFCDSEAHLHVIDLKYGQGVGVDAYQNSQLMLYALGVIQTLEFLHTEVQEITLHIVQPRKDHISAWTLSRAALLSFGELAAKKAREALGPNPSFGPSEKACRWCLAKATCRQRALHILTVGEHERGPLITNDELGVVLEHIGAIESWCKAIKEHAHSELEQGAKVPGFKLVEGYGRRGWRDSEKADKWLARQKIRVGERYTKKLISPAQAEKLLGKGAVDAMTEKSGGKPTLVSQTDKRPPLRVSAAEAFGIPSD